jgi:hypothetical protein
MVQMFHRAKKTPMKTRVARRMMEQMFHLAWRKVTAVTDEARKALSTRDDAMVTLEQLSAASAEPIEHLRNYVLAGVLTCDERGMFPLRSSMLAIFDFWEWKGTWITRSGLVMSGRRPLIKGYFGVALVVGAVMSSAFGAEN